MTGMTQNTHTSVGGSRRGTDRSAEPEQTSFSETERTTRSGTDHMAEHADKTARASIETAQETVASSAELAQRSADQAVKTFETFGIGGGALARRLSQNLDAMAKTNSILGRGLEDLSREWFSLPQTLMQRNIEGFGALLRCRSAVDMIAVHSDFARGNLQAMADSGQRIAEVSTQLTSEAARAIAGREAA